MDVGSDDAGRSETSPVSIPPEAEALAAYGARFLPLQPDSKRPQAGGRGRTNAVPLDEFFKLDPQNYGIALDGWAVVVDIDNPNCDPAKFIMKRLGEHATWHQRTTKGHHWLFLLPPGTRLNNSNLIDTSSSTGEPYGQILTNAYIVGPGSRIAGRTAYVLEDGRVPIPAPPWLIEHAQTAAKTAPSASVGPRRDKIPYGEHDNALASILGQVARSHAGLSNQALLKIANFVANESGILDGSEGYDSSGLMRLVSSATAFGDRKPEFDGIALLPHEWRSGAEVDSAPTPTGWLLPGFIPDVGLAIIYGDGKVGKTSLEAWITARITAGGSGVVYVASGETTFDDFIRMVALYPDADVGLVYEYPNPGLFTLPSKAAELEKALEILGAGIRCVLIDAVYSHFEPSPGSHEAARARYAMKPLNEVAQRQNLSIVATIHENAAGGMLGSKEMRNVARSVVRAVRKANTPLTIYGAGANVPQVDYGATFDGEAIPLKDVNGKPLVYKDLFGDDVAQTVYKLALGTKVKVADGAINYGLDDVGGGIDLSKVPDDHQPKRSRKKPANLDGIT